MFERAGVAGVAGQLADLVGELGALPSAAGDDAERIDRIAALERLKAAAYAAQLREVAEFAASQEVANKALGLQERVARRGIPEQVGLARKVSPASATRQISQPRRCGMSCRRRLSWCAAVRSPSSWPPS